MMIRSMGYDNTEYGYKVSVRLIPDPKVPVKSYDKLLSLSRINSSNGLPSGLVNRLGLSFFIVLRTVLGGSG